MSGRQKVKLKKNLQRYIWYRMTAKIYYEVKSTGYTILPFMEKMEGYRRNW